MHVTGLKLFPEMDKVGPQPHKQPAVPQAPGWLKSLLTHTQAHPQQTSSMPS